MDIVSFSPLTVLGFAWQPNAGAHTQTVIVKGTFRLVHGESVLMEQQDAPSEFDRAPYKPKADVVLVGHAHAPGKQPMRSWMTRMVVGEIDKSIEVWCDRVFRWQNGELLEGPRVSKVPLGWERAAGGPETNNPIGMRFDAPPDRYGMVPIPNLQPPGKFVVSRADTFTPIGFGPIGANDSRRRKVPDGWQQRPIPPGFEYANFQIAPPDQQVASIRPNERIVLENLLAGHARLVTNLPKLTPRAVLDRAAGGREEVRLFADTLWLDTDRATCSVVWRGRVALRNAMELGRIAVWVDEMPQVGSGTQAKVRDEVDIAGTTMLVPQTPSGPTLPFTPGASKLAEPDRRELDDASARATGRNTDVSETMLMPFEIAPSKALPFATAEDEDQAKTLPPMPKFKAEQVPFVPPPMPPAPMIEIPAEPKEERDILPAPPPLIGPLAKVEMAPTTEAKPEPEKKAEPIVAAIPTEKLEQCRPEEFPLEKCAALTASIARRKSEKVAMLEKEELTEKDWETIQKHGADAIKDETRRGKRTMLDRFDQAYVARLEEERGPITVEEYARLSVAGERGTVDEVLRELGLPRGAVMRIERVWMKRVIEHSALTDQLQMALDRARVGF